MFRIGRSAVILAAALVAPVTSADAAPSARDSGSSAKRSGRGGARKATRARRRGLPVLRSQSTPGRTRQEEITPPAEGQLPAFLSPAAVAALAALIPADHAELSAAKLADGNYAAVIQSGWVDALSNGFSTKSFAIHLPVLGAQGRDLTLNCEGAFGHDVTITTASIQSVTLSNGQTRRMLTIWDEMVKKVGNTAKTKIKVLIDTKPPAQTDGYRVRLSSESHMFITKCTLDLAG